MAVGLLDDHRNFEVGLRFKLAYLGLLVLRQFLDTSRLDEFTQGEPAHHSAAHLFESGFISGQKNEVIAQDAQTAAVGTASVKNATDQIWHRVNRGSHGKSQPRVP